jgi:Flp pilus assembly protein TadB
MKFPSLFFKTPRHKQFSFLPRYYDPKEEERKQREERLHKEIETDRTENGLSDGGYRQRIAGSFRSSRRRTPAQTDTSAAMLRLVVLLLLVLILMAYIEFGASALYLLLVLVPLYFFMRFRKG